MPLIPAPPMPIMCMFMASLLLSGTQQSPGYFTCRARRSERAHVPGKLFPPRIVIQQDFDAVAKRTCTDLSVELVAANSHSAKPWLYKFAGAWGNHEGSMLLWVAVLSLAAGAVLGAFLLGTLAPSIRERDVFAGMLAGLIVITAVWWATPIAASRFCTLCRPYSVVEKRL